MCDALFIGEKREECVIVAAREARTVKLEELLYLLVDVAVVYRHTKFVVLNICTFDRSSGLH